MKKYLTATIVFGMILASCGNEASKENVEHKEEILAIDSVVNEMDHMKEELEKSTEELDNLLDEL